MAQNGPRDENSGAQKYVEMVEEDSAGRNAEKKAERSAGLEDINEREPSPVKATEGLSAPPRFMNKSYSR